MFGKLRARWPVSRFREPPGIAWKTSRTCAGLSSGNHANGVQSDGKPSRWQGGTGVDASLWASTTFQGLSLPTPDFSRTILDPRMKLVGIRGNRCCQRRSCGGLDMTVANWTEADSSRALEAWSEYQRCHDMSNRLGQTAGIDPVSRSIWFGDSIQDVIAQRDAAGSPAPLFFVRVGSATYYRKGGRR